MRSFLITCIIVTLSSCLESDKTKVLGCIDSSAINYDSKANLMQDSSCIITKKYFNDAYYKNTNLIIDLKKYKDIEYSFVYNLIDSIKSVKRYRKGKHRNYFYNEILILDIDTIKYTTWQANSDVVQYYISDGEKEKEYNSINIPTVFKEIKVIEKVKNYKPRYYSLPPSKTLNYHSYILNPFSHYKYIIDRGGYSSEWGFSRDNFDPIIKEGNVIELDTTISYVFEDLPRRITANFTEDKIVYRYNLRRY